MPGALSRTPTLGSGHQTSPSGECEPEGQRLPAAHCLLWPSMCPTATDLAENKEVTNVSSVYVARSSLPGHAEAQAVQPPPSVDL